MEKRALLFVCLGLVVFGCAKNAPDSVEAYEIPLPLPRPKISEKSEMETQIATGEIKEILLTLKRVHFSFDTSTLALPARDALNDASEKLAKHPKVSLFVDGHTDERGTTEYNLSLGEKRARSVVTYLESLGVENTRLNHVSFGEETPIRTGKSAEDYAENRRVDFRLFKGNVEFVLENSPILSDQGQIIATAK